MKTKNCAICGDVIKTRYSNGAKIPPSRYRDRITCSTSCAAELRERNKKDDYPTRFCKVCDKPIPKVSSSGIYLSKFKYQHRKTCDRNTCRAAACTGHKAPVAVTVELSPIDKFIQGRI